MACWDVDFTRGILLALADKYEDNKDKAGAWQALAREMLSGKTLCSLNKPSQLSDFSSSKLMQQDMCAELQRYHFKPEGPRSPQSSVQ